MRPNKYELFFSVQVGISQETHFLISQVNNGRQRDSPEREEEYGECQQFCY